MLVKSKTSAARGWTGVQRQYAYPPLKAPTGFLTGAAATVLASRRRDEDRNVLELRRGAVEAVCRKARIEGAKILEAMTDEEGLTKINSLWLVRRDRVERVWSWGGVFDCA